MMLPAIRQRATPVKILVVTPFDEVDWAWFGPEFGDGRYSWEFRNLALFGKKPWTWFVSALRITRELQDHEVLITHHPYMAFYMATAMKLWNVGTPHYAFSFNHGNGRFFNGPMKLLAIRAFRNLRGVVVYSEQEKWIYGGYYRIPYTRFSFVHWGVKPPEIEHRIPPYLESTEPYVCCIGRNNRDFESFLEAVGELGIPAVVVCSSGRLRADQVPRNVAVRCDVPESEAMHILAKAALSVVPLKDASTGAGHMTIVSAMQLGVPQVITRLSTVSDYFTDGVHGLFVDPNSRQSLRDAIARLWTGPQERRRMSEAARLFAAQWLTEDASKRHLSEYLRAVLDNAPPVDRPPGWRAVTGRRRSS